MNRSDKMSVSFLVSAALFAGAMFFAPSASAADIVSTSESRLSIGGRMQMLGVLEVINDTLNGQIKNKERVYLFQKQARLNLSGRYNLTDYYVELMFGGEEVPKSNTVMSLLDYYADTPLTEDYRIKIGQFKVPYGRERLTDPGILDNADRSIQNLAFNVGRDVGFAVHGKRGNMMGVVGVFTGGGMNIPQRYIPEVLGFPMVAARVGVNNNLDKDVFTPYQVERGASDGARYAGYVNAFYTRDSRVGHGTALGVKYFDKSLLLNSSWNPYISSSLQAEYMQAGVDFALEKPLGKAVLLSEVEVNYGRYSNRSGEIKLVGGVVKQSVSAGKYEFGLRYAAIIPDANMAYSTSTTGVRYKIVDAGIIHEITPSIVINHSKNIKIVMDAPIGIGTPVVMERNNGPYDLMKQPDQTSYIPSGKVERQDIFTGRLMFQFVF